MVKTKNNRAWYILGGIVIVVLVLWIVIANINRESDSSSKEITLSRDNFLITETYFQNGGNYVGTLKESICASNKYESFSINYRLLNFPLTDKEIHELGLYWEVYSGGNKIGDIGFGKSGVNVGLEVEKDYNLVVCLPSIDKTIFLAPEGGGVSKLYNYKTNEICLEPISVNALC